MIVIAHMGERRERISQRVSSLMTPVKDVSPAQNDHGVAHSTPGHASQASRRKLHHHDVAQTDGLQGSPPTGKLSTNHNEHGRVESPAGPVAVASRTQLRFPPLCRARIVYGTTSRRLPREESTVDMIYNARGLEGGKSRSVSMP
jgi:hypothetical protein